MVLIVKNTADTETTCSLSGMLKMGPFLKKNTFTFWHIYKSFIIPSLSSTSKNGPEHFILHFCNGSDNRKAISLWISSQFKLARKLKKQFDFHFFACSQKKEHLPDEARFQGRVSSLTPGSLWQDTPEMPINKDLSEGVVPWVKGWHRKKHPKDFLSK